MLARVQESDFQIVGNSTYNSNEVKFDSKPNAAVIKALKGLKMRWNPKKGIWYGFATESQILAAIGGSNIEAESNGEELVTTVTDGYLGGGAVYGSKSHLHLGGSELAKAIRADLKKAGIKATVRKGLATYTDTITVTVKVTQDELVSCEEYQQMFDVCGQYSVWVDGDWKHVNAYYEAETVEEQQTIKAETAKKKYENAVENMQRYGYEVNHYHIDKESIFTEATKAKLEAINKIVTAYRYDESNAQVDYFDTNFYYDVDVKLA